MILSAYDKYVMKENKDFVLWNNVIVKRSLLT